MVGDKKKIIGSGRDSKGVYGEFGLGDRGFLYTGVFRPNRLTDLGGKISECCCYWGPHERVIFI